MIWIGTMMTFAAGACSMFWGIGAVNRKDDRCWAAAVVWFFCFELLAVMTLRIGFVP